MKKNLRKILILITSYQALKSENFPLKNLYS